MLQARKERYIDAMTRLASEGYVSVVSLILAVPIERKNMGLLTRCITGGGSNGYRTKERPNHNGIDFNAGPHAQGYAPMMNYLADGAEVTWSEFHSSYGHVVDVSATIPCRVKGQAKVARVTFRFAHMHNRTVQKGDKLPLWSSFGTVGSTGESTAAHKHFEVWVDGKRINPHDLEYQVPIVVAKPTTYIVQKGDTYGKVSVMFGVNIADLRRWNGWPDKDIPIGGTMWLVEPPKPAPEPEPPERPDEPPHSVEPEPEVSAEEFEQLKAQVVELVAKMEALKQALL